MDSFLFYFGNLVLVNELFHLPDLNLITLMKVFKNVSMQSSTLDFLQKHRLIEKLCHLLSFQNGPHVAVCSINNTCLMKKKNSDLQ